MKGDGAVHGFDCSDPSCVHPDHLFHCHRLSCTLTRRACVTRQMVSDHQRTNDVANETLRGQSSDYPLCVTAACPVGGVNRDLHDPDRTEVLKVYGPPGSKWTPSKRGHAKSVEMASRARLLAVGLLDDVPTLDTPPLPVPPEEDGEACEQAAFREPAPEAAPGGASVAAGAVREPEWAPKGVSGVPRDVPAGGLAESLRRAAGGDGRGRRGGGEDRPRLRVGTASAVGRGDREGRRPARGR